MPEIAYAHHEKLDGTAIPRRLTAAGDPVQSRMMTISDIFDALVAWDRPYKKAVPVERALDILREEARAGSSTPGCSTSSSRRRSTSCPWRGRAEGRSLTAPPLVIAHRGDSARRPENTLASFASALESGRRSSSSTCSSPGRLRGRPARSHAGPHHRRAAARPSDDPGRVRRSPPATRTFGTAYAGERIPTLAEVLGSSATAPGSSIEIKHDAVTADAEGGIEAQVAEVPQGGHGARGRAHLLRPPRASCALPGPGPRDPARASSGARAGEVLAGAREAGCGLVLPAQGPAHRRTVDRVRAAGLKLATWVIDDPAELKPLAPFDLYGSVQPPRGDDGAIADGLLDLSCPVIPRDFRRPGPADAAGGPLGSAPGLIGQTDSRLIHGSMRAENHMRRGRPG